MVPRTREPVETSMSHETSIPPVSGVTWVLTPRTLRPESYHFVPTEWMYHSDVGEVSRGLYETLRVPSPVPLWNQYPSLPDRGVTFVCRSTGHSQIGRLDYTRFVVLPFHV